MNSWWRIYRFDVSLTTPMKGRYGLAACFFFPWILDFFSGHSVMASLFGALFWGLAVLFVLLRGQLKDERLRANLTYFVAFFLGAWISLWLMAGQGDLHWQWGEQGLRLLTLSHATLLTAGFGMALVLLLSATLWLWKEHALKNRRTLKGLPSLEGLEKSTALSLQSSFWFWTAGLFFAVLAGLFRWQRVYEEPALGALLHYDWLSDPKVLLSIALWIPLLLCMLFRKSGTENQKLRYKGLLVFSILFVSLFLFMSSVDLPLSRHETLRWITR